MLIVYVSKVSVRISNKNISKCSINVFPPFSLANILLDIFNQFFFKIKKIEHFPLKIGYPENLRENGLAMCFYPSKCENYYRQLI